MVATVRLDSSMQKILENLSKTLNKKKSEVIRDAIDHYALMIEDSKESRLLKAVSKTKHADKEICADFEGAVDDSL